jgi:uncharacterized protein YkwD
MPKPWAVYVSGDTFFFVTFTSVHNANSLCVFNSKPITSFAAQVPPGGPFMTYAEELLTLINHARAEIGSPALSFNLSLIRAARKHSSYMLQSGHFSHTGEDRSSFLQRINKMGYFHADAAENIAFCPINAKRVFRIWLNSPQHHENITNPIFRHIGIAAAPESKLKSRDNHYWTLKLAAPLHFESIKENA